MVRRLRSRPVDDEGQGRAARLRPLDRQRRAARPASRSASSPATTRSSAPSTTDAAGVAAFEPGLAKGTDGLEPAIVVASDQKGDYGFVDMTQSAFDLSDRGVEGRDPPGAIDAFVYTERGVYRRGETVHAAVLLRDEKADAVGEAPVTVVVERPDGVEYSRTAPDGPGRGRAHARHRASSARPRAAPGASRPIPTPRPIPVGETTFLVEDYVPNRIEFDLKAAEERASPDAGAQADGRRALSLRRARRRPRPRGRRLRLRRRPALHAVEGLCLRPDRRERSRRCRTPSPTCRRPTPRAMPTSPSTLPDLPTTSRPLEGDLHHPHARARRARRRGEGLAAGRADAAAPRHPRRLRRRRRAGGRAGHLRPHRASTRRARGSQRNGVQWTLKRLTTTYQWFSTDGTLELRAGDDGAQDRRRRGRHRQGRQPAAAFHAGRMGRVPARDRRRTGCSSASRTFSVGYYAASKADTPGHAAGRARQGERRSRRHRHRQDRRAFRRQGQRAGRRRPAAVLDPGRRAGRRHDACRSPSARAGAPAPMSSSPISGRWTSRQSACRRAPSASPGSASTGPSARSAWRCRPSPR